MTQPAPIDPTRFEAAIQAFEAKDKITPPPADPTLFVGSSSFTRWSALEELFREFNALNRGFGGSTFPDLLYFFERVVTVYKPAKIVVYEGTNDIASGRTAQQVYDDFVAFVERVRQRLPQTHVYCISVNAGPARAPVAPIMADANRMLQRFIATDPKLHYIDLWDTLYDDKGNADERYYADPVHPNDAGYARWIPVITRALRS
jgi:lysophospholipase L1-like esterase